MFFRTPVQGFSFVVYTPGKTKGKEADALRMFDYLIRSPGNI
ncbi:hypothetical protein J2X54_003295 [Duganella sp. 3397]|nr:hypothetical protein [Duganella sp. 3397]MDR7050808.1 hypothetical protein [Duganella sp. 3397]